MPCTSFLYMRCSLTSDPLSPQMQFCGTPQYLVARNRYSSTDPDRIEQNRLDLELDNVALGCPAVIRAKGGRPEQLPRQDVRDHWIPEFKRHQLYTGWSSLTSAGQQRVFERLLKIPEAVERARQNKTRIDTARFLVSSTLR